MPAGNTREDFSIGSPISPDSTFPLYFFETVKFKIFAKTVLDIPVVYELIKKNNELSDNTFIHNSTMY